MLASLSEQDREKELTRLATELGTDVKSLMATLKWKWDFWARPNQLEPEGDWSTWLILAGRGFGKTRVGAETIRKWVCGSTPLSPGKYKRIALVAETASDAKNVMVEGESGLLAVHSADFMPTYTVSNRRVTWPNGAVAYLYNATEPDQLRGPQHDAAWCDELAKWQYAQATWDQLQFGLRLGESPRSIVTTTPRPIPIIKKMMADDFLKGGSVMTTRGATFDNMSNMPASFFREIEDKYGNTRLGRQELYGEILEDIPGALWSRESIDTNRKRDDQIPDMERIVVAVDPATSSHELSDETGIVVVGLARDDDGYARGYVLEDGSLKGNPEVWGRKAVQLYRKYSADRIVAEKNQGGEMVESVFRSIDRSLPITLVHASKGKHVRAEPISALYEQGRVHHVGRFDKLEDQMCLFSIDNIRDNNTGSPDRVDALVWGLTNLFDKITGRARRKRDPNVVDHTTDKIIKRWSPDGSDNPNMWMAG